MCLRARALQEVGLHYGATALRYGWFHSSLGVVAVLCDFLFFIDLFYRWRDRDDLRATAEASIATAPAHNAFRAWVISVVDYGPVVRLLDLAGTLPIDWVVFLFRLNNTNSSLSVFRVNRLLRLLTAHVYSRNLVGYIASARSSRWAMSALADPGVRRVGMLFFRMAIAAHAAACAWVWLGLSEQFAGQRTWLHMDGLDGNQSLWRVYGRALYWAVITMVTVGLGDIVPVSLSETVLAVVVTSVGFVLACAILGSLASLISSTDSAESRFQQQMEQLNQVGAPRGLDRVVRTRHGVAMRPAVHGLPQDPRRPAARHARLLSVPLVAVRGAHVPRPTRCPPHRSVRQGLDERELFSDLPKELRARLLGSVTRGIIARVPLFEGCSAALLSRLTAVMESEVRHLCLHGVQGP